MQSWAAENAIEQKGHGLAETSGSSANWFAAYTLSHHEKHIASLLTGRGVESFLPLYTTLHRWRNRCARNLELPLFPNYVFVKIDPRERVRVLEVPGVLSLIGFGRALTPLPELEIEALRCGINQRKFEPHPYLALGERVRIKGGAMCGLEGVLVRKKNNLRFVIALDAIMQSVAIEVDGDDLEPAPKRSCGDGAHRSLDERRRPRPI